MRGMRGRPQRSGSAQVAGGKRHDGGGAAHHDGQHDHGAAGQLVLEGGAPGHALHVGDVPAGRKVGADAAAGGMLCRHCSTNFEASCLTRCQTYVPSASTPRRSRLKSSQLPEPPPEMLPTQPAWRSQAAWTQPGSPPAAEVQPPHARQPVVPPHVDDVSRLVALLQVSGAGFEAHPAGGKYGWTVRGPV